MVVICATADATKLDCHGVTNESDQWSWPLWAWWIGRPKNRLWNCPAQQRDFVRVLDCDVEAISVTATISVYLTYLYQPNSPILNLSFFSTFRTLCFEKTPPSTCLLLCSDQQ